MVYPRGLGGGGGKVGTLNISWIPMPIAEWNADVGQAGYIVSWKRYDMTEDQWTSVSVSLNMEWGTSFTKEKSSGLILSAA